MRLIAVEVSAELWTAATTKSESTMDDLNDVVSLGLEHYVEGES
jgi:hypothetical protein